MGAKVQAGLAVLLLATAVSGQVKESLTVSYVEVPVTVIGRDGSAVKGLTAANFELLDEGKARPIASFDAVDFSSVESMKATSPLSPAARRNFLLVFDLTFSSPASLTRAQQAARNFVTKMVQRRDRVGVATVDVDHGFRLLTSFTSDRKLVDAAIARPRSFRGSDPLQLAGVFPLKEQPQTGTVDADRNGATAEMNDLIRRQNVVEDQYNREKIDRQVGLLAGLATTLRAVSGQKHLVLLSEGFDPRLIQGRDARVTQQQVDESVAIEHGEIWKVDSDNRYGSASSMSLLDKMNEAAHRSDVIVDAIDIRGVRTGIDPASGYDPRSNEGLHLLTGATGGTVFKNSNDLSGDFQRVVKAQEVVYVLGFQAPASSAGKFHNLRVKLVGVPGARVTHRSGYYEAGSENAVERSLTNAEIVLNDIPQEGIRLACLAAPFATAGPDAQVPVILEIDGTDLAATARKDTTAAEIFTYAIDDDGLVRDSVYQRLALDLTKVGDSLRNNGVKYYATLALPPGHYAIKSLVRAAGSDRRGFVRQDVVVPASGELALSQPFFLEDPGSWLMVKGGSHDATSAAYPFEMNGEPFIPSAGVSMRQGTPRRFAVFVVNASPEELSVETTPPSKVVSRVKSAIGSKLLFEVDGATPQTTSVSVTLRKGGEVRTSTIPVTVH